MMGFFRFAIGSIFVQIILFQRDSNPQPLSSQELVQCSFTNYVVVGLSPVAVT